MSFGRFLSAACFILVIWLSKASHTSSTKEVSSQESLSNEDLRQLLFLLDDHSSKELEKLDPQQLLNLEELLLEGDNDHTHSLSSSAPEQNEPTTTVETTTTPSTTTTSTTTTSTEASTTTPTTTTTVPPPPPQIARREDFAKTQPSNEDLVQQLSLFNSLLMSLSKENYSEPTTPEPNTPPPLNQQQVDLLKSLFGSFSPMQTTETSSSTLLKRQTESTPPTLAQTPSPSSPDIAALTELLTQISQAPVGPNGNLNLNSILPAADNANNHLKNFHNSNTNLDPAASTQLSGLLNLLGTLGSLSQLQQQTQQLQSHSQQPSTLFNFGAATTPKVASPLQSNFLTGLLQQQAQSSQQAPNIFGNLFSHPQQANQAQQPLNFGNLITPGIGSVISTMSNIFGGTGSGGKPRVRGKGVDTRLGLGYRFGDAADAQVMWDIGPQLFTEPLQNEVRYPMTKNKRQDIQLSLQNMVQTPSIQSMQAKAQAEKEQQIAATRRFYNRAQHQHSLAANQNRRQFHINPPTSRTPSALEKKLTPYAQEQALKELWQLMEMQKQLDAIQPQKRQQQHAYSYTPTSIILPMSQSELLQLSRNKQVIKRASTPTILHTYQHFNQNPTVSTSKRELEEGVAESLMHLRTQHPSPVPNSFLRKRGEVQIERGHQPQNFKHSSSPSPPGLFNLNIFGRYRGQPTSKPSRTPPRQPQRQEVGSHSQMSRWDLDSVNHRFDNFKNTNGELVMTDSKSNDRFYARNENTRRGQTNLSEGA